MNLSVESKFNFFLFAVLNQIDDLLYKTLKQKINKSNTNKFILNDSNLETQKTFLERTYWDKKLYNYFIKK